ncbi:hypothetical protein BS47DRAFT_1356526 [Hydnum rufescens UP504]|uniref:Uncharacterized protein n=1 Tax=Hydnum rufescens UP504 TaxID=1448309 RepID=A0A9P6ABD1_9AGAM|nr:hypothetical protein BS47DRAFT_1356526 [Hydnum rufescens UP504]
MQKSSLVVQPEIMQAREYGLTKERIMITPKMNILQIPIIDEFRASSKSKRTAEFTAEKGLWTQNPCRTPGSHRGSFLLSPTITDPEVIPI